MISNAGWLELNNFSLSFATYATKISSITFKLSFSLPNIFYWNSGKRIPKISLEENILLFYLRKLLESVGKPRLKHLQMLKS